MVSSWLDDKRNIGGIAMKIIIKSWEDICQVPGFTLYPAENRVANTSGYQLKRDRYDLVAKLPQPVFAYSVCSSNVDIALRIKVGNVAPVLIPYDFIDKILVE